MANLKEIIGWFSIGKTPTAEQFRQSWSSFWHKSEKLPIEQIMGLAEEIAKATTSFKGYHTDEAALKAAYPKAENKKDFFAWVGSKPTLVWKVYENGKDWENTGDEPTEQEIDLAEYAKKTNPDGNEVVYAPLGLVEVPDVSGLAPLFNGRGEVVVYGEQTEYDGATNITGNENIANDNVVLNIDAVLPRDTQIKEIGFTLATHLSDANFVFGVFKKEGNSIECLQRYTFKAVSAGELVFPTNDEAVYPKGSYIGFFRGARVSMGIESLESAKSYIAKRNEDVYVGSILDITSTSNDLFAYSFKMGAASEKDSSKDILFNSSLKFYKKGDTVSEMRQSPHRVEFLTRSSADLPIDEYFLKNGANNYDITLSSTFINKYYGENETYIRFFIDLENGEELQFGRILPNSSMLGVWLNKTQISQISNIYLLSSSVRLVNSEASFKMYVNNILLFEREVKATNTYLRIRNGNNENRYIVDILDSSFRGVSIAKNGIDYNQAVSYSRYKDLVLVAYVNSNYKPTLAVVNLSTGDIRYRIFTEVTMGQDRHNYFSVIVDKNENVHIAGNAHDAGYTYWVGALSDLDSIQRKTVTISSGSLTYPEFLLLNNGRLIFITRLGSSGNSRYEVYEYNYNTQDFDRIVYNLIDGKGQGAYCSLWTKHNDWYYTTFTWRDNAHSTGNLRNGQVNLIKTQNFIDYFDPKGEPLVLPVARLGNANLCLIDNVPYGVGLHNQWGIVPFVWNDKLMVWYTKENEHGYFNVFIASPNNIGDYETKQITQFTTTEDFVGGNGMGTYFDACVRNCGEYLEFSYFFEYTGFRTLKLNKLLEVIADEPYIYNLPKRGNQKRETIWRELFNDCTIVDTSDKVLIVDRTPSTQAGSIVVI